MKVLHVIHSLTGGGAERQLLSLVNAARISGIEMAAFCVRPDGAYLPVKHLYVADNKHLLGLSYIFKLRNAIKEFKPDIIQVWLPPAVTIPAMVTAFLMHVPIVFSYRNVMAFRRKLDVIEYVFARLACASVVSNTPIESCTSPYQRLYRQKHGHYVPNSVSVPCKKQDVETKRDIKELIFVGRITQAKNWTTLLAAAAKLKHRNDWKLTIYGKGEDEPALYNRIEELNLGDRVSHHGFSESIYDIMASADALIFPSFYEGMPNVLLEALAIGLYTIASDIAANRQVLGSSGCTGLFPPENVDDLCAAIEQFLDGKVVVAQCIARGREIAGRYSPENNLRLHLEAYRQVLNAR